MAEQQPAIIDVTPENIDGEHICCAIGNDTTNRQRADQKKAWMRGRFPEGHRFKKLNVRGKVFVEYEPIEHAWAPIEGDGYWYIQCLWVSGRYKGQGWSTALLEACEADARASGARGLVAIASEKKRGFMVQTSFYERHGFSVCDTAEPYFQLVARPFDQQAPLPRFTEKARAGRLPNGEGLTFHYSHACPFNEDFANVMANLGRERGVPVTIVRIETAEQAKALPVAWGMFSVFYDEELISHEVTTEKKFRQMLDKVVG
jgi:ribosomal protein S18 acetylase RimI-like enzyme